MLKLVRQEVFARPMRRLLRGPFEPTVFRYFRAQAPHNILVTAGILAWTGATPRRKLTRWQDFLYVWFGNRAWARRLIGGHWERWVIDIPGVGEVWHPVGVCSYLTLQRPVAVCRGIPTCEDW